MSVFTDEVVITIRSGRGGDGIVSFRREKYVPKGGPDGGDGGAGGDVIFVVDKRLRSLYELKLKKSFKAENGKPGQNKNRTGARGKDCIIYVPPGTVVKDKETGELIADLTGERDRFIVLKGGRGGYGNSRFATSVNRAPRISKPGEPGKEREVLVQLKIIADAGLVGLPNAGKSTLLSVLTRAKPKVGDYPFTTLYPNLGVMDYKDNLQFVIADIPGIIEGAHKGQGLGIRFLKHIERTKLLVIMIDLTDTWYDKTYSTIIGELKSYSKSLLNKKRIIVGSKADIVDKKSIESFIKTFDSEDVVTVSSATGYGIESLKDKMAKILLEGN